MTTADTRNILKLFIRAEKARKNAIQPMFANLGLVFGQGHVRILNALQEQNLITQKELARQCHLDETTISRSLDKLEQSGFIQRQRDPSCRRSFLICLTEEGKLEAEKANQMLDHVSLQMCSGISAEELEAFFKTLRKVCENLENPPQKS